MLNFESLNQIIGRFEIQLGLIQIRKGFRLLGYIWILDRKNECHVYYLAGIIFTRQKL